MAQHHTLIHVRHSQVIHLTERQQLRELTSTRPVARGLDHGHHAHCWLHTAAEVVVVVFSGGEVHFKYRVVRAARQGGGDLLQGVLAAAFDQHRGTAQLVQLSTCDERSSIWIGVYLRCKRIGMGSDLGAYAQNVGDAVLF